MNHRIYDSGIHLNHYRKQTLSNITIMITEENDEMTKLAARQERTKAQLERRLRELREQKRHEEELKEHEKVFDEKYKNDPRTMEQIGNDLFQGVISKLDRLSGL